MALVVFYIKITELGNYDVLSYCFSGLFLNKSVPHNKSLSTSHQHSAIFRKLWWILEPWASIPTLILTHAYPCSFSTEPQLKPKGSHLQISFYMIVHDLQQRTEQCFYLKSVYVTKLFLKRLQNIQPNKKPFHDMYRFVVVATPTHLSWTPPWYHGRWGMIGGESFPLCKCSETGSWGTSTVSQGTKACPLCWWSPCCMGKPPFCPKKIATISHLWTVWYTFYPGLSPSKTVPELHNLEVSGHFQNITPC